MISCTPSIHIYWEDIPESERVRIIESDEFNQKISQIPKLTDDDNEALLLRVTGVDAGEDTLPFYFYTFNRWVVKSDGAVSEIMYPYCMKMILNHPDYSFEYFKSHPKLMENYILLIIDEFIFIDSGEDRENSYRKFCMTLRDKMEDFTRHEKVYHVFCKHLIDKINEFKVE